VGSVDTRRHRVGPVVAREHGVGSVDTRRHGVGPVVTRKQNT
jgi:hypothetical protein